MWAITSVAMIADPLLGRTDSLRHTVCCVVKHACGSTHRWPCAYSRRDRRSVWDRLLNTNTVYPPTVSLPPLTVLRVE